MPDVDPSDIAEIRATSLTPVEASGLVEQYLEGDCLTFAFAVHWMTGWPVEAVSERGTSRHLHFAAISPDEQAWDAAGPRTRQEAGAVYGGSVEWEAVDAMRLIATQAGVDEDAITGACHDAVRLIGPCLDEHIKRIPVVASAPSP